MISAKTKLFALIGDPVEGSLSPAIHNAAFKALGLDCVYLALRVPQAGLADAIAGAKALGLAGLNVTHPHKVAVMGMLDELDESASLVGAVNTIKNEGGRLIGSNTDGEGAVRALEQKVGRLRGKRVLLLGAGGAGRAIAFSLAKAGAKLTVANRTASKAEELAKSIRQKLWAEVGLVGLGKVELASAIKSADVLINSTAVGMHPDVGKTLVTADMMHKGLVVNDIVYEPLQTRLLREAMKAGASVVDGLGMLVHQGALAFEIWTGRKPPIELMEREARRELRRR